MNKHELLDVGTMRFSGLVFRDQKLFVHSVDAPPLVDAVAGSEATVDEVTTAGRHDVVVDTPVGSFEAAYMPWQWLGPEYPTIVYHHGSGENPLDFGRFNSNTFRRLFVGGDEDIAANVIAVRAPFHDRSSSEYARAMGDLKNFVGMVASSAALLEAITTRVADESDEAVILAGTSLGGFVLNLHRAQFGTADRYVPLLAGAVFGELFISSVYRHMVAESALRQPAHLRDVLDFEAAFTVVDADDCSPLLGRYDRIVEYDTQRPAYAGMRLTVLEKGHVTGALASDVLRGHILNQLPAHKGE